jgi:hypothetical protein
MKALILACVLLAGCASLPGGTMDNAPVCEVGRVRAYVVSMFGWLGVAFKLTDESAATICKRPG